MLLPAYINVNVGGIPALRSLSVNVGTAVVKVAFNNHRNIGRPFRGIMVINIAQAIPAGTTDTLPIVFTSDGGNDVNLTTYNGENVTVADITGTGIYLCWYESQTNTLQLINV
jgi:hypothetical protein